ncbi:hypothetical protein ACNHKD_17160 [Methylocystis sp. JAN1]|uniref:CdiA C-terminal domain-containing protein n=1 Tax=Methylocystis sp. JAN1 TaxID=3397211 RepID=UPI003FA260D4
MQLAQNRGGERGRGVANEPGSVTASQLDRLETTRDLAREAETRVREIDPSWKPEPTLSDPNDIESRIARNEDLTRQANERYAEHLREKYGDQSPSDESLRSLTGPRAQGSTRDDAATNRGRARENDTADIVWLNRHNVEQLAQRSNAQGVKQPDFRIDGEVFDTFAPASSRTRNIWSYAKKKIYEGQADNILINLMDTPVTIDQILAQFRAFPIPGLKRFWVIDQHGKLHYLF